MDDRRIGVGVDRSPRTPIDFGLGPRDYSPRQIVIGGEDLFFVLGGSSGDSPPVRTGWWRRSLERRGPAALVAAAPIGASPILSAHYEPVCSALYVCVSIATPESDLVRFGAGW